MILHMLVHNLD